MGTIISEERRFIFVHIPKTAGLSVASRLEPYRRNAALDRKWLRAGLNLLGVYTGRRLEPLFGGRVVPEHAGISDLCALDPALDLTAYFKFAVVRNPWDRLVSTYLYHLRHARSRHLRPGYWAARGMDFSRWLNEDHARRRREGLARSQVELLRDPHDGHCAMDRVVRFEALAEGFADVARQLGLDGPLPVLNRSENRDYRTRYRDADAELVATLYADDISEFGYAFE